MRASACGRKDRHSVQVTLKRDCRRIQLVGHDHNSELDFEIALVVIPPPQYRLVMENQRLAYGRIHELWAATKESEISTDSRNVRAVAVQNNNLRMLCMPLKATVRPTVPVEDSPSRSAITDARCIPDVPLDTTPVHKTSVSHLFLSERPNQLNTRRPPFPRSEEDVFDVLATTSLVQWRLFQDKLFLTRLNQKHLRRTGPGLEM